MLERLAGHWTWTGQQANIGAENSPYGQAGRFVGSGDSRLIMDGQFILDKYQEKSPEGNLMHGISLISYDPVKKCFVARDCMSDGSTSIAEITIDGRVRKDHITITSKTGETLLKTVLGPMFLARNLKVMSWVGSNFLGNNDGAVLDAPASKDSKLRQKDAALREMLGGAFVKTDIQYVPSLGDWKTAWDLIHFQGFLGTPMTMTFTWQGCDSALAAPLVLDLVRLVTLAWNRGESGLQAQLAPFFKNPLNGHTHDFHQQMAVLYTWLDKVRAESPKFRKT